MTEIGRRRLTRLAYIQQLEGKFADCKDTKQADVFESMIVLSLEASELEATIDDLDRQIFEMKFDADMMTDEEIQWWIEKDGI
jgi:hypothetical protein